MLTVIGSRGSSCSARARGDGRPETDYDIAVFIEGLTSIGAEAGRIAAGADARTGFMGEVRRDSLDLCSRRRPSTSTPSGTAASSTTTCASEWYRLMPFSGRG